MAQDFFYAAQLSTDRDVSYSQSIYNEALLDLQKHVQNMGGNDVMTYGLPQPAETETSTLASEFKRLQFPVKLSFAITISKN